MAIKHRADSCAVTHGRLCLANIFTHFSITAPMGTARGFERSGVAKPE